MQVLASRLRNPTVMETQAPVMAWAPGLLMAWCHHPVRASPPSSNRPRGQVREVLPKVEEFAWSDLLLA
jgi:hypothetical protein